MIEVPVQVYSESKHALPKYEKMFDSGMDVKANLPAGIESSYFPAGETHVIPTGLWVAIPPGYEIQVRPRSGMSLKTKLRVANSPGTVDSPYRGEIGIILTNTGSEDAYIYDGDRVAQLVLVPVIKCAWQQVSSKEELGVTDRGAGGFGSTGTQ